MSPLTQYVELKKQQERSLDWIKQYWAVQNNDRYLVSGVGPKHSSPDGARIIDKIGAGSQNDKWMPYELVQTLGEVIQENLGNLLQEAEFKMEQELKRAAILARSEMQEILDSTPVVDTE
jgi:serine/threonine protein phosphatase PrpC